MTVLTAKPALHEAMHGVVALAQGLQLLEISVVPQGDEIGRTVVAAPAGWAEVGGRCFPMDPLEAGQRAAVVPWLLYLLAPIAGQLVFGADPHTGDDHKQVSAVVARLELAGQDACIRQRLVEARQLVADHQAAIVAVSEALLLRPTLSGTELREARLVELHKRQGGWRRAR